MLVFAKLDDTLAFIRKKGGFYQQVALYTRGKHAFVPVGSSFVQVRYQQHDGTFTTSNPDITVLEYESHFALSLVKSAGLSHLCVTK